MDNKIKDLTFVLLESVETKRLDARARVFLKWGTLYRLCTPQSLWWIDTLFSITLFTYWDIGSLQGYYAAVINIDSIRLKEVLRMYPYFQQLFKTWTAAYAINSNHINIISKLPSYTVIQYIVPRILDDEIVFNLVDPGSIFDVWHTWTNGTWEWLAVSHWAEDVLDNGYQRASAILPCIGSMTALHLYGDILSNITKDTSCFWSIWHPWLAVIGYDVLVIDD